MDNITNIDVDIYNKHIIYTNCIVDILENTVTGKISVGWYPTEETEKIEDE